jgi:(1->4)-alpha-D-glucan 1-alpha-D-glucosylmutase
MRIPLATYRIQFNSEFGFDNAEKIVDYLTNLGVSELYASPIFKARSGSTHGYDVVDPTQLNSELGTPEMFDQLVHSLQQHHIGWLQDIVPNHMAYDSENYYLMDVLENGLDSPYLQYFDIAWNSPFGNTNEQLLAPLLGDFYGECLENGQIQLNYDQEGLTVNYYGLRIPVRLESYATFLVKNLGKLAKTLGRRNPDFIKLLAVLYMLRSLPTESGGRQRQDQTEFVKGILWELYTSNPDVKAFIDEDIKTFNGEPGHSDSFNSLDKLLSEQFFRLAYWKVGAEEINYRRFFTVNELISVKIEDSKVFNHTHDLICKLVQEGKFTGLRIDHIDGLYNPKQYLERLRERTEGTYILAEKILQPGEDLPEDWNIQGTSGYDFLNYLNGIFCQTENQEKFDKIYQKIRGDKPQFEQIVLNKKHLILDKNLAGDLDNLVVLLKNISRKYRYGNDFTLNGLKRAIAEVLTRFPIYRTYITENGISEQDRQYIQTVIQAAKDNAPFSNNELNFIEKVLLLEYDDSLTEEEKQRWLYFVMRMQQYTGPLMAKGVEDTAFYVYNRLLSLNEVGGNPERFGVSIAEFHEFNRERQNSWNAAMNASATHDTKRGEDLRARLNVLSEIPDEWETHVKKWRDINRSLKTQGKGMMMPDANDEYGLYQTLVGAFPFEEHEMEGFSERVQGYITKAIREAKVYTAWLRPNNAYEEACVNFARAILEPSEQNQFLKEFLPFQKRIASYGIFNSLSQTLIKITSPGIPDFYQGAELWDLSLVDPDNRRPVNFEQRRTYLNEIQNAAKTDVLQLIQELLDNKPNGKIKLFLIKQALAIRAQYHLVFQQGPYIPLEVTGQFKDHAIAFARQDGATTIVTIVPRFLTSLIQPEQNPLGEEVWADTKILSPSDSKRWHNAFSQQKIEGDQYIMLGDALNHFPVALLISE